MDRSVYCSPDFDRLVDALADEAEQQRSRTADSFIGELSTPVLVVVPSLDVGAYLEHAISRRAGVAVNYRFEKLHQFWTDRLDEASDEVSLLDRDVMKTVLLERFDAVDGCDGRWVEPVRDYIDGAPEGGHTARQARCYQLARELSSIYEEYVFTRYGMLEDWRDGKRRFDESDGPARDVEEWQADLWCEISEACRDGLAAGDESRCCLPMPELFGEVEDRFVDELADDTGDTIHIFGFAGFGSTFVEMFDRLAAHGDIEVNYYFDSPSGEPPQTWEDDETHPALSLWGEVGRQTFEERQSAADDGLDWLETESKDGDGSILETLQARIAGRDGDDTVDEEEPTSLRFLDCPGLRREVEVVANDIWKRMGADDELRFSDVAVMLPDGCDDKYLPHIESVFSEFEDLPYVVNSVSLSERSTVVDAVELLLELPRGRFRRRELLSLLVHPNFVSRYRDVDDETWIDWVDDLNVLYGADREHQQRNGQFYVSRPDDLFNWDQGMKRLAMGAFVQPEDAPGDYTGLPVDEFEYEPYDLKLSDWRPASGLNAAVTSLIEDARWLHDQKGDDGDGFRLEEWAEVLATLVDTYVVPSRDDDADYGEDVKVKNRIIDELGKLAESPDIGEVSYETAYHYASDLISDLRGSTGQKFTGGVVVGTVRRLRGLPFDHVYLLGAAEGTFPAQDPRNELDLRLADERPGDTLPSMRDRYHFLQTLQAAGDSLTLSWVGRDATTGETLPPSSVVDDLRRIAPVDDVEGLTTEHPLRRYNLESYAFPGLNDDSGNEAFVDSNLHPEAFAEARMRLLRREGLDDEFREGRTVWTGGAYLDVQERIDRWTDDSAPSHSLGMTTPTDDEEEADEELPVPSTISIGRLNSFLKSPLQGTAKTVAGVYDDEEDTVVTDRESFSLETLDQYGLVIPAFEWILAEERPIEGSNPVPDALRQALSDYRPGDLPLEFFRDIELSELEESLSNICNNLRIFSGMLGFEAPKGAHRFEFRQKASATGESDAVGLSLEIDLPGSDESVFVTGTTPFCNADETVFIRAKLKGKYSISMVHHLKNYVSHLAVSAADEERADQKRTSLVLPEETWKDSPNKLGDRVLELPTLSQAEAYEALQQMIGTLIDPDSVGLYPADVLEELDTFREDRHEIWETIMDEDDSYSGIRTKYGPVHDYLSYPPPDDPAEVLRRRFRHHPTFVEEAE